MAAVSYLLHGNVLATCTRKVLFVAEEVGIPIKVNSINLMAGEQKKPEYLKKQPFGVIPVLEERSGNDPNDEKNIRFQLYESRAIARYINTVGNGNLVPVPKEDPHRAALFDQFASIEYSNTSTIITILRNGAWAGMMGKERNEEAINAELPKFRTLLGVLNRQLESTKKYLLGEFSMVDIFYTPYFVSLRGSPEWKVVEEYPQVAAWIDRIEARPAWKKVSAGQY